MDAVATADEARRARGRWAPRSKVLELGLPELTNQELHDKIVSGELQAVSVDTNVFDRYHCNLSHALLLKLEQFKATNVELVFSEIVTNEIIGHIRDEAAETQRELKKALRNHRRRWLLAADDAIEASLSIGDDATIKATHDLNAYVAKVGAQVLAIKDGSNVAGEATRRYFELLPPFEAKETKKHEFPDALALLSLEAFVKPNDGMMLCVSNDGGWKLFAAQSPHLVVLDELDVALSLFNQAGEPVANEQVNLWRKGQLSALEKAVEDAVSDWSSDLQFLATGDGPANYYTEDGEVAFQSIDEIGDPTVVAFGGKQITFTVKLTATLEFYADFYFFVHDHVDGDDVNIGSASASKQADVQVQATITATYGETPAHIEDVEVTVTGPGIEVDFGYVDPYEDEDPTFEKY